MDGFQHLAEGVFLEGVCLQKRKRLERLLKHRSLRVRLTFFVKIELLPLSRARSLAALTFRLAYVHPADLLSFVVVVAGYFYDGGWIWRRERVK